MADKVIDIHKQFVTNSIPDQRLTHPNQLTIKMWNDIVNILRVQANDLTKYLQDLHHWLIGDSEYGTISFPAEHSSFIDFLLDAHEKFIDGTTILGKAKADRHGNVIDEIYLKKIVNGYDKDNILSQINNADGTAKIEEAVRILGEELTNTNSHISSMHIGEINENPYSSANSVLNNITTSGMYSFSYSGQGYIMIVQKDSTSCVQTCITSNGPYKIQYFSRTMLNGSWSLYQKYELATATELTQYYKKTDIVARAEADQHGNVIDITYYRIDDADALERVLQSGVFIVGKAKSDRNGNIIDTTYAPLSSITQLNNTIANLESEHDNFSEDITKIDNNKASKAELQNVKDELLELINNLDYGDVDFSPIQTQIDDIRYILTSDDTSLDTLQELVNALKNNTTDVNDIFSQLALKQKKIIIDSTNDVLTLDDDEMSTHYEVVSSASIGGIKSGDTVSGTIKEVLDMLLGTPTSFSFNSIGGRMGGNFEKGYSLTVSTAKCTVVQGTAKTLDSIVITSGGVELGRTDTPVNGEQELSITSTTFTDSKTFNAVLTYNTSKTISKSISFNFLYKYYYGTTTNPIDALIADNITSMTSKLSTSYSNINITMNQSCSVIALPKTTLYNIYDENGYNVTENFETTRLDITNQYGSTETYTIYKLKTAVTGTKTYRLSLS